MPVRSFSAQQVVTRTSVYPKDGTPVSYVNGFGGTRGSSGYVSYDETPRRKPEELFKNGTWLVAGSSEETNPLLRRTYTSPETITDVDYLAVHAGNALRARLDDRLPEVIGEGRNALLKKVKDQNLNLAQSLAEFRSTANTVGDLARNLAKFLVQPKAKLGLKLARRLARRPHDKWSQVLRYKKYTTRQREAVNFYLGYIYGLRPIMSDIEGSLQAIYKRLEAGYSKSTSVRVRRIYDKTVRHDPQDDQIWQQIRTSYGQMEIFVWLKSVYKIDSNIKALAEVGITNPLSVVYETMPYSFVLDWIIPIGDYLSSLDALVGVEDFMWVENYYVREGYSCDSGHTVNIDSKYRTQTQFGKPGFTLVYRPSTHLINALNGILLLKQRYS